MEENNPLNWRKWPAQQQPNYPDPLALSAAVERLKKLPPLVDPLEVESLHQQLVKVSQNELFLLQAGDCVERFDENTFTKVATKVQLLLHMASLIAKGLGRKVVIVGRIGGQYAKPRSRDREIIDGQSFPIFRGELVNGYPKQERAHDPARLLKGYDHSCLTMRYIRQLCSEDSHFPSAPLQALMRDFQLGRISDQPLIFSSHEGLILDYETALSREVGTNLYNLSTHMPWIGHRTRNLHEAHIQYFSHIRNPIGIKIGPPFEPDKIVETIQILNPENLEGKITLITRLGAENVRGLLPPLIKAIERERLSVIWCSDPMHGNDFKKAGGKKVREFDLIQQELSMTVEVLQEHHLQLGGLHCEVAGDNVIECLGGDKGPSWADLPAAYESYCDPRFNYNQSLEFASLLCQISKNHAEKMLESISC